MKSKIFILAVMILSLQMVFKQDNSYAQWTACDNGYSGARTCDVIHYSGGVLYAARSGNLGGIYKSTNGASSWVYTGLDRRYIRGINSIGNNIFAGTDSGIFLSTNSGVNWVSKNSGLPASYFYALSLIGVSGNKLFASFTAGSYGLYVTTNNGDNWTISFSNGGPEALGINGNIIYTSSFGIGVYKSTNAGLNWAYANNASYANSCIAVTAGDSVIVGRVGFFRSLNGGTNWTTFQGSANAYDFRNFLLLNNNLFAACVYNGTIPSSGVYMSTNFGVNWINRNQGLPTLTNFSAYCLASDGTYIYVGGLPNGVQNPCIYKRSISNIVGINTVSSSVPEKFDLYQNYPNPFNPSTKIQFSVPRTEYISLKVYDMLGKEIEILVNEKLSPGKYEVTFDGSKYSSGVYLFSMKTASYTNTKKMSLIK